MPKYRAYIIGSDGDFQNSILFECANHEVAFKKAEQLVGGHHVELWQQIRKIATFDHNPLSNRDRLFLAQVSNSEHAGSPEWDTFQ